MLLERVAPIFDQIPMLPSPQRVMIIAKGVAAASQQNDNIKRIVQDTDYINALKNHAQYRATGAIAMPPALKTMFEAPSQASREQSRV